MKIRRRACFLHIRMCVNSAIDLSVPLILQVTRVTLDGASQSVNVATKMVRTKRVEQQEVRRGDTRAVHGGQLKISKE